MAETASANEEYHSTLTSKHVITAALRQLSSIQPTADMSSASDQNQTKPNTTSTSRPLTSNILTTLPQPLVSKAKSALLTFHFLFPFDFLPALDLIDRHLIQRLQYQHSNPDQPDIHLQTFYVQSASAITASTTRGRGGRYGNRNYAATKVHYEVRLDSWNCSCPAFAAAGMRLILGLDDSGSVGEADTDMGERETGDCARDSEANESHRRGDVEPILIGGVATRGDAIVPVCKHILAAALCDAAPVLFDIGMITRKVTINELAAWAAGWGET